MSDRLLLIPETTVREAKTALVDDSLRNELATLLDRAHQDSEFARAYDRFRHEYGRAYAAWRRGSALPMDEQDHLEAHEDALRSGLEAALHGTTTPGANGDHAYKPDMDTPTTEADLIAGYGSAHPDNKDRA